MKEIYKMYTKYENRILVKAIVGVTSKEKLLSQKNLSHKQVFRSVVNNYRNSKHYVS